MGYPGFVTKFRVATDKSGGAEVASGPAIDASNHVDYENFRHVCHKWHYKMAKALVVCLESKDYVQIRNALTVLIKILPFFPVMISLAMVFEKRIEKVRNALIICFHATSLPFAELRFVRRRKSTARTFTSWPPATWVISRTVSPTC